MHRAYNPFVTTAVTFHIIFAFPKENVDKFHYEGLDCSHFARHYFGNVIATHHLVPRSIGTRDESRNRSFLFHWLLRCFTSPGA